MKKRIISLLLVLTVIFSSTITVFADEENTAPDTFYELDLPFVYADTERTNVLPATFMIPGDSSTVYFKAEDIALFLEINYFDFKYEQTYTSCAITSAPFGYAVIYEFNENKVMVYAGGTLLEYEAPAPALFKDGVAWLPFEFTMNLFNVSYAIKEDQIAVEPPAISQLMVLSALQTYDNYAFDWISELGYTKTQHLMHHKKFSLIEAVTGVVNDGNQWANLATLSTIATDSEKAQKIAALFVSPSATEIDAISNTVPYVVSDTITDKMGDIYDGVSGELTYKNLVDAVTEITKEKKHKNNKKLKSYLKNLKKKKTKKKVEEFLKSADKKISYLDLGVDSIFIVIDYIGYFQSVSNKNEYASDCLKAYSEECSFSTHAALKRFAESNNSIDAIGLYLNDNFADIVLDAALSAVPLFGFITLPADLTWSLFSKNIAESFILSEHTICYQNDARINMNAYINAVFGEDSVRKDLIEEASEQAYAYLKFSTIAREYAGSAINSSSKIDKSAKKDTLDKMEKKNKKIGNLLAALELGVEGYFPDDVSTKEDDWCTDLIIQVITQNGTSLNNITQDTPIIDEFQPLEGDITPDEAVSIVVDIMGGKAGMLLTDYAVQSILGEGNSYNIFALEQPLYIEEMETYAYLVRMGLNEDYDEYCVFVPVDGSAAWLGIDNGNDEYYCYLDVDLKNFKLTELMASIEKIYVDGVTDGLVIVNGRRSK